MVVAGGGEGAVPEGVGVGVGEGVAFFEVGVAVEVVFEGFPGGFAVGVEEVGGFGGGGEVVAEVVPVFERCRCIDFGFVGVLVGVVGGHGWFYGCVLSVSFILLNVKFGETQ